MWHKLSIASDNDQHLKNALNMFNLHNMTSYRVIDNTLYIYHKHKEHLEKIPFPSKKTGYIQQFIKSWLASIDYPQEPDHDGDNQKGFEVFVYASGGYCDYVKQFEKPYTEPFVHNENDIEHDGWDISIVVNLIGLNITSKRNVTMFNKKIDYEIKWYRVSEVEPPVNTNILVLVNGEINEGYLHEHELWVSGVVKDTTLYTNSENYGCGSRQHTSWGDDPYWMPIPAEKPKQIKSNKKVDVLFKKGT